MHASVSLVIVVGDLTHQIMDGINEMHSQADWGVWGMACQLAAFSEERGRRFRRRIVGKL